MASGCRSAARARSIRSISPGSKALIERYQPALFSEHLAWSSHDSVYLNDLLPLPYTEETLARVCEHIDEVQDRLGRRMLLENPPPMWPSPTRR